MTRRGHILPALSCWLLLLVTVLGLMPGSSSSSSVYIDKSAYRNVVVEIRDNVPVENCQSILHNLEVSKNERSLGFFFETIVREGFGLK